jgi:non-ribosomal peptide synthetase component F
MILTVSDQETANGLQVAFEAFGVRVALTAESLEAFNRLQALLPPVWEPCPPATVEHRFAVVSEPGGAYGVTDDGVSLLASGTLDMAVMMLDTHLKARIAVHAHERIFVHAGVVGHNGGAIVIPGKSFTGKTTLVAALVRAGAIYYSDEYAVLDDAGLVHPYAKPLSLRDDRQEQSDHHVESLGGVAGDQPLRVATVVITGYRPGTEWRPQQVSAGRGALALLSNTVPARLRPEQAMQTTARAVDHAIVLEGERGEAAEIVERLLDSVPA